MMSNMSIEATVHMPEVAPLRSVVVLTSLH